MGHPVQIGIAFANCEDSALRALPKHLPLQVQKGRWGVASEGRPKERCEAAPPGACYWLRSFGSRASRIPSPMKFTLITVSEIITPGKMTRSGLNWR